MHIFFDVFLSVAMAFLGGAVTPGPDMAMIVSNVILRGRKAGILIGLGLATGIFIHGFYTIVGFGELYRKHVFFQDMVRYGGGCYLIYLGIKFFMASAKKETLTTASYKVQTSFQAYRRGLFTNLLNPFAALFVISIILNEASDKGGLFSFLIVVGLAGIYALFNIGIVYFLGNNAFRQKFLKISRYIFIFSGIILCFYGIKFVLK